MLFAYMPTCLVHFDLFVRLININAFLCHMCVPASQVGSCIIKKEKLAYKKHFSAVSLLVFLGKYNLNTLATLTVL